MISPIDIALIGVVLGAVALLVLRRRRSGATPAAAHDRPPIASGEAGWAEVAATLAPVREAEIAPSPAPDDGWGEIITDPGWYLPGEADMNWHTPAAETTALVPAASHPAPPLGAGFGAAGSDPATEEAWLESWLEAEPGPPEIEEREAIGDPPAPVPTTDDVPDLPAAPLPEPEAPPRAAPRGGRRRTVIAGVGVGALGLVLAGFGWNAVKGGSSGGTPASAAAPAPASAPAAASGKERAEAMASLRRVDRAAAQDHPASARRILASVPPAVLAADPAVATRARILRHRIDLTEGYLAAIALARAGRPGEARERMLVLVPFRDAGVRARAYGVEIAKDLVAQARATAAAQPARAAELLERAEDIAPSLSAIRAARADLAGG